MIDQLHAQSHCSCNIRASFVGILQHLSHLFEDGHETQGLKSGDELLQSYASHMQENLAPGDQVARIGGSVFAVLLAPDSNLERSIVAAKAVASKLGDVGRSPVRQKNREGGISARVGVAIFPRDGENVETLFDNANEAMMHAKGPDEDHVQFFSRRMAAEAKREVFIENGIRQSLANGDFEVYYQPQYSLREARYIAVEALLRWPDPTEGFIPPSEFIPVAERAGLMNEVGAFVMGRVCKDFWLWLSEGIAPERVCINLSPVQLETPDLVENITAFSSRFDISPEYLEFEVTESAITSDVAGTIANLQAFKSAGFRIAIDDFGSGNSSLASLQKYTVDVLKIDRNFIHDINTDESANTLLDAILDMASKLEISVVAEGVETVKQQRFLAERDCELTQGSLYSRPLPAAETEAWLRELEAERPVATLRRA